jgi:DNA polymerase-3 subunit epsilon
VVADFIDFIDGAELIIHNAAFDVGFLDHELNKIKTESRRINDLCTVLDTLKLARDKHPGQKNNLDALCKRYGVDNSNRELHGALLDSEILADVYLAMTGGQVSLSLATEVNSSIKKDEQIIGSIETKRGALKVIRATENELAEHQRSLERLDKASGGQCVWLQSTEENNV